MSLCLIVAVFAVFVFGILATGAAADYWLSRRGGGPWCLVGYGLTTLAIFIVGMVTLVAML